MGLRWLLLLLMGYAATGEILPYIVPLYKVTHMTEHTTTGVSPWNGRTLMLGYEYWHECSGTLLSDRAVLTTVTCAVAVTTDTDVMPALTTSQGNQTYYNITEIIRHPGHDSFSNEYNIAIMKIDQPIVFAAGVGKVDWDSERPADGTICTDGYWSNTEPFEQEVTPATIKQCTGIGATMSNICAEIPGAGCKGNADGGALVCSGKVAGVFNDNTCGTTLRQYHELSQHYKWIYYVVNASSVVQISFTALSSLMLSIIATRL